MVLQDSGGGISVAYGSSNLANAQTLNDVTLNKDSSGDITSAVGTNASGNQIGLVSVGTLWAAIPLNADGTFPNTTSPYPSITLYGEDSNTGQMNAVLTFRLMSIFMVTVNPITLPI